MWINNSEALNEKHKEFNPDTLKYLENLKWMDIDPSVFEHFENKILWILDLNPEATDIVNNNLDLANLKIENTQSTYASAFWDIMNNPDYQKNDEDESLVS